MDPLARENIRAVLAGFDVTTAQRAADTDPSEEVILLGRDEFARIDPTEISLAIMAVLPSTKVWVVEVNDEWIAEPL